MGMRRGSAHGLGAHIWRWHIAALAVALLVTLGATSASAAKSSTCSVKNSDSGRTYSRLQQAVDAAKPGARLVVRGTCLGSTVIDHSLVIQGIRTDGKPATLKGAGDEKVRKVRVLRVVAGVTVKIRSLTIKRGYHGLGGGILNRGTLRLRDAVVRESITSYGKAGAAIYNSGTLSLDGHTAVANNDTATSAVYNVGVLTMNDASRIRRNIGGSLTNDGTVTMNDASSIVGNWVGVTNRGSLTLNGSSRIVRNGGYPLYGGGVRNDGSLTLNDSSSISGNYAGRTRGGVGTPSGFGGGVYNRGTLTLTGSSTISGNSVFVGYGTIPPGKGGGLYNASGGTLVGVNCAPQTYANVYGNTPDDCLFE